MQILVLLWALRRRYLFCESAYLIANGEGVFPGKNLFCLFRIPLCEFLHRIFILATADLLTPHPTLGSLLHSMPFKCHINMLARLPRYSRQRVRLTFGDGGVRNANEFGFFLEIGDGFRADVPHPDLETR